MHISQIENVTILPNSLAIWGLGQMGLIIKGPDAVIYIDPCLSNIISERMYPPPIKPEEITNADYVLCSHEHIDHLDPDTIKALASPQAKFVTSGWCVETLKELGIEENRILVLREPQTLGGTSLKVTPIPSAHPQREYDEEKGDRWLGFLLEWNGVTIYFAGDTVLFDDLIDILKRRPHADIAMLPVNGRDWFRFHKDDLVGNLHPKEAARVAEMMKWSLVIAGHNDLLKRNSIPMGEIAQAFADEAPGQPYKILQPGELLYFVRLPD